MKNITYHWFCSFCFFCILFVTKKSEASSLERGKQLFFTNCTACHMGGNNIIIPEKNLKKESLEANGMNNLNSIMYQIINGKNGMPAFGGRLQDEEIEILAAYVLTESRNNFLE
jgi:cytochrome c6